MGKKSQDISAFKKDFSVSKKAFSLFEIIAVLLAVSISIASGMTVMSVRKASDVKMDPNGQNCILKENGNPASSPCSAVITGCISGNQESCNILISYANSSIPLQVQYALNALKEACRGGGTKACDYIIQSCYANSLKCDIASTDGDLRYFATLLTTDTSQGRAYTEERLLN